MIKGIFEKHTPNIILNGERLIAFFPRSVTTRMHIFTTAIQYYTRAVGKEKESKGF